MGNGLDKILQSVIAVVFIGVLIGSGTFALWVNILFGVVLVGGLIYIWTH